MRILHVIPFFTPERGGTAQVAYQMARHLGERGHSVTVVASDYGIRNSSFAPGPFEVVLLPAAIARWGFYVTPGLPRWAARNLGRFDVVHMHEMRTYQNAVVSRLAVRQRIPYVLSAHGTLPVIVQRQMAKRVYDRLAGRALLASASRLVAVSPFEAEQYRQAGIDDTKIRVVYNGLDLREYAHLPARGQMRRRLGVPDDAALVVFLGRVHRIKGIDHLIAAFAGLRKSVPNACLLIAGPDDGDQVRLQNLTRALGIAEHVIFAGGLYGADKLAALVDADVVAAPSQYEIFGLVPFEALMCGTPVIVANNGGSGQLIQQSGAGYLVPYGDIAALTAALVRAVTEPKQAAQKVRAGQAYVRAWLDWSAVIAQLETVYRDVLAGGPGTRLSIETELKPNSYKQ